MNERRNAFVWEQRQSDNLSLGVFEMGLDVENEGQNRKVGWLVRIFSVLVVFVAWLQVDSCGEK